MINQDPQKATGKIRIKSSGSPRGNHLQPVIDFLIEQGNIPLSTEFYADKTGVGEFKFKKRIDIFSILDKFEFPENIEAVVSTYYGGGVIWDKGNAVIIKSENRE